MATCFTWLHRFIPSFLKRRPDSEGLHLTSASSQSVIRKDPTDSGRVTSSVSTNLEVMGTQVPGMKHNEKVSEVTVSAIPITKYIRASSIEVLSLLQSAAAVIPVPMLQDAIGITVKIIELCQEASAVEGKVQELQDRVGHVMIIVLSHLTEKNDEGDKEVLMHAIRGVEDDVKELLETLRTINKDLADIKAQNRWLLVFYKDLNLGTVNNCINRLSTALEKFKLSNDLNDSAVLQDLRSRLQAMSIKVDGISLDVKHVVNAVDNIQHNLEDTRQAFDHVMARVQRSGTLLVSNVVIRQEMPLKPEIFCGRDSLVDGIARLLTNEETSRVCLLGPGGMGKTSVALAVVECPLIRLRFLPGNCFWVPCIGATSAARLLEVLYVQLEISMEKQVTLDKIIAQLSNTTDPHLILLDNFETSWNTQGSQKEVEDILRQLAALDHVAIIVTMRGRYPPCENAIKWELKNLEPTDAEASLHIFHAINPGSKEDPNVSRLLHALGNMPFAVTLMASLGKEGQSTAEELLQAWTESGPDIISDNPEKSMNRSISLSVESPLVQQNTNALLLLHILSLLPAGTTKENLRWWAPTLKTSMIPSAIAALSKAALLLENKGQDMESPILLVVPVVQSFMRQHNRIPDQVRKDVLASSCRFVLHYARRFYEPEFRENSRVLAAEDPNIQCILFDTSANQDSYTSEQTLEALIAFCWFRCDTKPSSDLATRAVGIAEAFGKTRHLALAEWCLGRTYYFDGAFPDHHSFDHLQKAYQLFDSPGDAQCQKFRGRCGIDLVDTALAMMGDNKREALRLALEVEATCSALSDEQIHGRSLLFVGLALLDTRRGQEALEYLIRAKSMLRAAGNALDLANVYQVISRVHREDQSIPQALIAMEIAQEQAEKSNLPSLQGHVALEFAEMLFKAEKDEDAMKYTEIALQRLSYAGNTARLADAFEWLGYGYLRRGHYQDALSAYNTALKKHRYSGVRGDSDQHLVRCMENVARIEQKLENNDTDIGFYRPAMCFVADNQNSLLFYPSP